MPASVLFATNSTLDWIDVSSTVDSSPDAKSSSDLDFTAERVLTAIALCGISVVILTTALTIFRFKDRGSEMNAKMGKTLRTLFVFFVIALWLNVSSITVWSVRILPEDFSPFETYEQSLISTFLYDSGKWSMSMFFVLRLHFIFKDSAFKVRTWKLAVLVILQTATWCLCLWGTLGVILDLAEPNTTRLAIQYTIIMVMDLFVTGYYFRRFLSVVIMQAKVQSSRACTTLTVTADLASSPGPFPQPEKTKVILDQKFIDLITKSTLLNLIGVLSSCVLIGYLLYLTVTDTHDPSMGFSLQCLDAVINTVCIFLTFAVSSKYYDFGCKYCHRGLRRGCTKIPEAVILRRRRKGHVELAINSPAVV